MQLGAFSISLAVKDIAASLAFYQKLGFEIFGGDIAQNWLILKNGDAIIGLFQGMFEKNILTFNPGWDANAQQVDGFTDIREFSVGGTAYSMTVCGIHEDGGVSCAGSPLGANGDPNMTATRVAGITGATKVIVGTDAACALAGGKVLCWGSGSYGQLGNGATDRSATPVEVSGISDAVDIGGGSYNYCATRRNGSVSCWGSGDDGQLTNGQSGREANSPSPVAVRGLRNVASIGKMGDSMCAALRNGNGMCWGANDFGQTGHNESETDDVMAPWDYLREQNPPVAALGNIVEMGCGWNFCCALHAEGGISCAGSTPVGGSSGFLGLSNQRSTSPILAPGITFPVVAAE